MKKADILILLAPGIAILGIGIMSLWMTQIIKHRRYLWDQEKQQKWQVFLQKLDNGESRLNYDKATEDSMLQAMRVAYRTAVREQAINESMGRIFRDQVGVAVFGCVLQVVAVLIVRKRLLKKCP